jgi:hypothetical protein
VDGDKKRAAVRDVPGKFPQVDHLLKYEEHLANKNKALKKRAHGNLFD